MKKTEAIDRVEAANSEWCDALMGAYMSEGPIIKGTLITSDDLWSLASHCLRAYPREPRAMGAVMRNLHKFGYIKPLNKWQPSTRRECHGRPLRVWRTV